MIITLTIPDELIKKTAEQQDMTEQQVQEAILKHYQAYDNQKNGLLEEHVNDMLNF
jgi:hypothetical protein